MRLSSIVGIFTLMLTLVLGLGCAQLTPGTSQAAAKSFLDHHSYSIPSSAFHAGDAGQSASGTIHYIRTLVHAPVYLPEDAKVTKLSCGGRASNDPFKKVIVFTLRRNDPKPDPIPMQETDDCEQGSLPIPPACMQFVDMATTQTSFDVVGFEFVSTNTITDNTRTIDNSRFNYYIVATVAADRRTTAPSGLPKDSPLFASVCAPQHPACYVGFCRIQYCFDGEQGCTFAPEGIEIQ